MEQKNPKNKRVALSAKQIQEGIGAELCSICQNFSADGKLDDSEIRELQTWLSDHRECDLQAISFLDEIIQRILADGVVTPSEQDELFEAIARVLPPEYRKIAKAARREVRQQEKGKERERNGPKDSYEFIVAGARRPEYQKVIRKTVNEGMGVILRRQLDNRHDKHATQLINTRGIQFGWVPKELATYLARDLDKGCLYSCGLRTDVVQLH